MQSVRIEQIEKLNNLFKEARTGTSNFADSLCELLVNDFGFFAAVLFKIEDNKQLRVIGKSTSAKQSYLKNSLFDCKLCKLTNSDTTHSNIYSDAECEIQTTDFVIYEQCLIISLNENQSALLKIAKKNAFAQSDKDNLKILGDYFSSLLNQWLDMQPAIGRSVSDIITEISHELRTPTNSILGFASLLNEDNLTSSQAEYVSTIKESAYHLLAIINDLIEISKVDAGVCKETKSKVSLKIFIEDVIKIFKEKITDGRIEFLYNIDKNITESLQTDIPKLRYLLMNILSYAVRLTDKGKITIFIALNGKNKINFKIQDTGNGIPSAKLKDIFKPFSITDLGNTKQGAITGLSLILSKKYAELLGGELHINSTLGQGTTYTFSINGYTVSGIEGQIAVLPKPEKDNNKVLVIEDDYATSKLLSNYLHKWGYDPTIVNSGEQALKIIEKESFLAVLMDIVLPDMNGLEVLKQIREHKNTRFTPVIVCSVEAEQQKAFMMGAVEYFVKPIKYNFLVEVLTSYRLKKDSNILCVDDDVPTLNLVKQAIESVGLRAVAESNSTKVMNLISDKQIDLAIIDLDMPDINGFELIKLIKSNPKFKKLPIIIYTGKENYSEDLKNIDGLFAELLQKQSSNIEDLADTINAMLNRYEEPSDPEVVAIEKDSPKILLVEDYKHSQIIVTRLLKKNNFDSVVVVENGALAVEEAKHINFDLILMDMQMPVMNGFEATQKIREFPGYKDTPIIALTAFAMKGDREKCLEAGATDYIPKPIDSKEFIQKVKYFTSKNVTA